MQPLSGELLEAIDDYIARLFVPRDEVLERNLADAAAAQLPAINVSATQGKLIYLLARLAGARRILEIGTLGGYSTTWLARALPSDGRVVTLEYEPRHADVARRNLERAGLANVVDIRVGDARVSLRGMLARGEAPFDVVFIDADKTGYVEYLDLSLKLSHPGTLILADNVVRHGRVLTDAAAVDDNARAARAFNAALAAHPDVEAIVLPIVRDKVDGLAIGIVRGAAGAAAPERERG
jgi:predicted O-methyltransferase YrrM